MARVVVTSVLPVDIRPWLPPDTELWAPSEGMLAKTELLDALRGADGLISLLSDRIDASIIDAAPRLKIIANYAVGIDNIDLAAATRRGVVVTNTPDVLTQATADLTFALLLGIARRTVEGDTLVRMGTWKGWAPDLLLGADVWGRTLGLIGFGRIGRAVAHRARGFDMRILYCAPRRAPAVVESALGAQPVSLETLLGESDFVSLHCPLTPQTRGLLGAAELRRMKTSAFLINTARGACVDEEALADALEAGRLGGAGLDVFAREPAVTERLLRERRVLLAPHVGSATTMTRTRMAEICARAVSAVLGGERPANVVNLEVLR